MCNCLRTSVHPHLDHPQLDYPHGDWPSCIVLLSTTLCEIWSNKEKSVSCQLCLCQTDDWTGAGSGFRQISWHIYLICLVKMGVVQVQRGSLEMGVAQGHDRLSTKFHEKGFHRGWVIFGFGFLGVGSMRLSTGEWDLWYPFDIEYFVFLNKKLKNEIK